MRVWGWAHTHITHNTTHHQHPTSPNELMAFTTLISALRQGRGREAAYWCWAASWERFWG